MHDHLVCACVSAVLCDSKSSYACVCLVVDYSMANPSVEARGSPPYPNGDVLSSDITSPGRPLVHSQSFYNTPGKQPCGPPSGSHLKRPSIVYCCWKIVMVFWQRISQSSVHPTHKHPLQPLTSHPFLSIVQKSTWRHPPSLHLKESVCVCFAAGPLG